MGLRTSQSGSSYTAAVSQRFEAKYPINAMQAQAIREYIRPYVNPDAHGREYPVTSIYLDSPDLALYWSSARGEERRRKLRIRTYAGGGSYCFFEVKHRFNQIVKKDRAVVRRDVAEAVLAGDIIHPDFLNDPDRDGENLHEFQDLVMRYRATPKVVVRYMREAYVGKMDEPLRITFDSQLTCLPSPHFDPDGWDASPHWVEPTNAPIVLEIKFTDTFPGWVEDVVRHLDLLRDSYSKYVVCVDTLASEGVDVSRLEGAWS